MNILRTPLVKSDSGIFLKAENLQEGGSYKMRGVARLLEEGVPGGGLSTVSAGNLGRSLALACQAHGIPCTVYVPDAAPDVKKAKIDALGAKLVELPFAMIWDLLLNPPGDSGFVHPIHSRALLEGYGSIAREIAEDLPAADAVVLPFGLGGLTLGVAATMRRLRPRVRIYAAELAGQAPLAAALEGRREFRSGHAPTFVDAIGTPELLPGILARARQCLAGSIVVTLQETRDSLRELHSQHGLVVEGAAAVAHAAARRLSSRLARQKNVAVLSGGNISAQTHARECSEGLAEGALPASG
ncbi:MAG: threonine ammonia-lyase [Bdellovibrionota bacterium]